MNSYEVWNDRQPRDPNTALIWVVGDDGHHRAYYQASQIAKVRVFDAYWCRAAITWQAPLGGPRHEKMYRVGYANIEYALGWVEAVWEDALKRCA